MTMEPLLLHPVYPSSSDEICWWTGKSENIIAEKHPFKGVENYFTDSLLYQDSLETDENIQPEEPESSNEVDTEPEAEEECL